MNNLFVKKESNTFSDTIECLGLASIVERIFRNTDEETVPEIIIEDKGYYYQISYNKDLNENLIENCPYFDFFVYVSNVSNKKDDLSKLNFPYIDYKREKEIRDKYYKLTQKERQNTPNPIHRHYDIIRTFGNISAYQKAFWNCRNWENHFPQFLRFILRFYEDIEMDNDKILNNMKTFMRDNNISFSKINALQDINPDKGKGANQTKANGISPKGQNAYWLKQVIRFTGVWQSFVTRYIGKDFKTYSLVPKKISYSQLKSVYNSFKPYVKGNDSIKLDITMILLTTIELIKHNENYTNEWAFIPPADKISGFQFAYYKNLGQRPAVTNIGFLGLPNFIEIDSQKMGDRWISVCEEHQNIITSINENYSSNISMLQNYRQFISASDFDAFFEFNFQYASFLTSEISNEHSYIKPFTIKNMEVLMCTQKMYEEILKNNGFQAIASAIRNSTIIPILHNSKKDVKFGLSQKLKIASKDKDSFITEISGFVQNYNEELMLKDYHQKPHHSYVTTEQLEDFCKLMDEEKYSAKLIAGLLVAYGFAKEPLKEKTNEEDKNG